VEKQHKTLGKVPTVVKTEQKLRPNRGFLIIHNLGIFLQALNYTPLASINSETRFLISFKSSFPHTIARENM